MYRSALVRPVARPVEPRNNCESTNISEPTIDLYHGRIVWNASNLVTDPGWPLYTIAGLDMEGGLACETAEAIQHIIVRG